MPMPNELGHKFTPHQKAEVIAALKMAIDTLNSLQIVQLTPQERSKANSISHKRLPYVQQTFGSLAPQNPHLQPAYLSLASNTNNYEMMKMMNEIMPLVKELNDRYTDYSIASQHIAFRYMVHFYKSCQLTPLGKVVCGVLAPLFSRPKKQKT